MHPLTEADVFNRIGGQPALTQLIDPAGTGTWSPATLQLAMQDAWNFVVAAGQVQVETAGLTVAQLRERFPDYVSLAGMKSLKLLWVYGSSGQALPPRIDELDKLCDTQLQLLAERRRKHGAVGYEPAISQRVAQIDNDPHRTRMTLESFRRLI